jgi:hypothetical protein
VNKQEEASISDVNAEADECTVVPAGECREETDRRGREGKGEKKEEKL